MVEIFEVKISEKIKFRVDSLIWFIERNEQLPKETALEKIKKTDVYKKLVDESTMYWTMPTSTIVNEYLSSK